MKLPTYFTSWPFSNAYMFLYYSFFSISRRSHIPILATSIIPCLVTAVGIPISYFLRGGFPTIRARGSERELMVVRRVVKIYIPMRLLVAGWRLIIIIIIIIITIITIYDQYARLLLTRNIKISYQHFTNIVYLNPMSS